MRRTNLVFPSPASRRTVSSAFFALLCAFALAFGMVPQAACTAYAQDGAAPAADEATALAPEAEVVPGSDSEAGAGDGSASGTGEVAIVFTNDVHCAVTPYSASNDDAQNVAARAKSMGYAGVGAFAKDAKTQYGEGNVTLIDAGDAIQGGAVGTVTEGEAIVELMNALGYDIAVPGNHEFDYGMERFMDLADRSSAMYLSCNFTDLRTGETPLAPYRIVEYDAPDNKEASPGDASADGVLTVAYVGISTPETLTKSSPASFTDADGAYIYGFCEDATGEALYESVQGAVDDAREDGADYVVAVGHLGNAGITDRWTSKAVIANTTGIDAMIDGHSHEAYVQTVANDDGEDVVLAQTGTKLANVGELVIDPTAPDGQDVKASLTSAADYPDDDPDAQAAVDRVIADLAEELDAVVGRSEVDLYSEDVDTGLYVRWQETNLGDFVADAYRAYFSADIGLVNGGGVRSSIAAGDVTKGDLINVQPFGNELCLVRATGQNVLDALEMGVSELPDYSGGFLQVSGLTFKVNTDIPSPVVMDDHENFVAVDGERRVYDVTVNGKPLDPDAMYTVASHGYMLLQGGDGMTMFQGCDVVFENVVLDNQALIEYMGSLGGVIGSEYADPEGGGRIQLVSNSGGDLDGTDDAGDEGVAGDEEPTGGESPEDGGTPDAGDGADADEAPDGDAAAEGPFAQTNDSTAPIVIGLAIIVAIAVAGIVIAVVRLRRR